MIGSAGGLAVGSIISSLCEGMLYLAHFLFIEEIGQIEQVGIDARAVVHGNDVARRLDLLDNLLHFQTIERVHAADRDQQHIDGMLLARFIVILRIFSSCSPLKGVSQVAKVDDA